MIEARLDEYDREEWRLVVRELRPDITDEEFEVMWAEFIDLKRRRALQ